MVSIAVDQTPKVTAGLLLLGTLFLPYASFSQPLLEPVGEDVERQIAERIAEEQRQSGPHSAELIGPLSVLALLYQERGDNDLATAAIQRATQVIRANYGLRSLDQAPLIRQSIRNEEARGDPAAAWDLEQELLTLARQHPNDLRTVPVFREIADKRMDLLRRYVAGEFPPQMVLGCFYGPSHYTTFGSCYSGSRRAAIRSILADARRNYADAIRVMLRNELYSSDELRELEMQLLRSSLHGGIKDGAYYAGRQSLRRLLTYDVASGVPRLTQLEGVVRVADWDLLFGRNGSALETYELVHDLLEQTVDGPLEQLFSPQIPVILPTFLPNPLASEDTPGVTGHIDVAFEITKYGRSRGIEILDTTTANVPDATKNRLVRLIVRSRFRPRVVGGLFASASPVVVRYHLRSDDLR